MSSRKKTVARRPKRLGDRRKTQLRLSAGPIADFELQGGKIVRGSFIGSDLPTFWLWNNPPELDERFAPFYRQVVAGKPEALVQFYRKYGLDPGSAFYQCIGYLAGSGNSRERKAVQKIMGICKRGGPPTSSLAKRVLARKWETRLLPPALRAQRWTSQQRRAEQVEGRHPSSRTELWEKYLSEKLNCATPAELQSQLLNEFGPRTTPPEQIRAVHMNKKEAQAVDRSIFWYTTSIYLEHDIVPRSLFFDLAKSPPNRPAPSVAVRRFARKLVI